MSINWKRNEFGAVTSEDYRFAIGHAPARPKVWSLYDRLLGIVKDFGSLYDAKAAAEALPAKKVKARYNSSLRLVVEEV